MEANIIKKIQFTFFILTTTMLTSCNKGCNTNRLNVNVKSVEVNIDLKRFDIDLFRCKNLNDLQNLHDRYGNFYDDFVIKVMSFVPDSSDTICSGSLLKMINNKDIQSLYDSVQNVFQDDNFISDGLNEAMKHYKYYFKNDSIPKFITFISVLTYPNTISDNYVGIGLDMYLGKEFPYYNDSRLNLPRYFINHLSKDYLLRNTIKSFIEQRFDADPGSVFIERAVQMGRIYYMMDALCPDMPDSIKIEYSLEKLNWMKLVEKEMWIDLVNRKVLYSRDRFENDKYFTDGPFTNAPNVSPDSPPRVGEWLGWQIVRKYMESHPEVSLNDLMNEKDLLKIFKESGYRPK